MLSEEVSDTINCKDASGKKQGWWIYYKVLYNPIDKPDELAAGNYVPDYSYGKYKDGRRIGKWIDVNNVHLIYERRIDSFFYKRDTICVKSLVGLSEELYYKYIGDSAIKEYDKRNSNAKH